MKQRIRRETSAVLAVVIALGFSLPGYAGRRHTDVENIGNRKITGNIWGIFPNFVSLQKEIALGAQVAAEFEQTARLIDDPVVSEYIDRVGQNIVKHSDAKVPFQIKVVDTDEVNAFAFPGGYFYVNKGLILKAENEAELAGVMAHEISHVAARHATARLSKAQILQYAAIPALFVGGYWAQYGIYNGGVPEKLEVRIGAHPPLMSFATPLRLLLLTIGSGLFVTVSTMGAGEAPFIVPQETKDRLLMVTDLRE